ncbi:MEG-13 [Schistosoma mansoni]|uniref:MEG-13 n=1 Tax=Schistosoma mansoni TaxID=6183 RepID=UPI00022DC2FC|nr:MEG-13 [Schistosoma mansoni]|eukprot:XP_018653341.1 MEG-13 [Schistosoma mansoni]
MYYVDYIQFDIQMDITYSWCIICLINLLLNGKPNKPKVENSTTDGTTYTTTPSHFSTSTSTNDATNSKFQRIFYMIVGLISLMAIN